MERQKLVDEIKLCETQIEFLTNQANAYKQALEECKHELSLLDAEVPLEEIVSQAI